MNQYNLVISILYSNVNKNVQKRLKENSDFKFINIHKINTLEYINNLERKFPDYTNCEFQTLVDVYNNTIDHIRKENEIFEKRTALKILAYTAVFCELADARFPDKSLDPFLLRCKMNCTCLTLESCEPGFYALCGFIGGLFIGAFVAYI